MIDLIVENPDIVLTILYVVTILFVILYAISRNKKYPSNTQNVEKTSNKNVENTEYNSDVPSNEEELESKLPYRRRYLLTKNEYSFYKSLKNIADKLNLTVLAKVRLADLIEVSSEASRSEYLKYFGKIQAKHIDFMLCKKENLYPELLIELNDNSHKSEKRVERDEFVIRVLEKAGYKLLVIYGTANLEQKIIELIKPKEE